MNPRGTVAVFLALACAAAVALPTLAQTGDGDTPPVDKARAKRQAIDEMAGQVLDRLFQEEPGARAAFDASAGYAVFDSLKFALLISGGGGVGVAVDRTSGERTYMKMATGGVGLGLGGQSYQIVFLFEDEPTFRRFVDKGWQADASASAAAGTSGENVSSSFRHGMMVFQFTNSGLMAQADVSGTKFWKAKKIND